MMGVVRNYLGLDARARAHSRTAKRPNGVCLKKKKNDKNERIFFKVPIKIVSIFHDPEIWFYRFVFFTPLRHSQVQNTSFRALLSAGSYFEQNVGRSGPPDNHDKLGDFGHDQCNSVQTKVS